MLKGLLEQVRGRGLVLKYYVTGSGERVPSRILSFRDGRWVIGEIGCWSSRWLGLGSCNCFSHEPWIESGITRSEALNLLREYIAKKVEDEKAREEEQRFFDLLVRLADLLATGSL